MYIMYITFTLLPKTFKRICTFKVVPENPPKMFLSISISPKVSEYI